MPQRPDAWFWHVSVGFRGARKTKRDLFIAEGQAALMLVPSVLVPQENNIMLNPLHPDATKITSKRACAFPLRS